MNALISNVSASLTTLGATRALNWGPQTAGDELPLSMTAVEAIEACEGTLQVFFPEGELGYFDQWGSVRVRGAVPTGAQDAFRLALDLLGVVADDE